MATPAPIVMAVLVPSSTAVTIATRMLIILTMTTLMMRMSVMARIMVIHQEQAGYT